MSAAVVSAIAALSGVGLGQLLARSAEYRKWLRSERHAAARDLLAAAEALRTRTGTSFTAHMLRHSHATGMEGRGVSLRDVQEAASTRTRARRCGMTR